MKTRVLLPLTCVLLSGVCLSQSQGVIYLVRHADRSSIWKHALSRAGEARARCLASTLKDAHISAVFATDIKRTQQTAAPVASEFHLKPEIIPKVNTAELVKRLQQNDDRSLLVVGHSDTLPKIVQQLGAGSIPKFADREYDRLIVVPVLDGNVQRAIVLRYCSSPSDAAGIDRSMH